MIRVAVFCKEVSVFKHVQASIPRSAAEFEIHDGFDAAMDLGGVSLAFVEHGFTSQTEVVAELARHAVYTVLVIEEEADLGELSAIEEGLVDDLLLKPIRIVEVLGKIKHVAHLLRVTDLTSVNHDLKTLIEKLEEDVRTTRSIQKALIPVKFAPVPGLKLNHKYLAGMKSGGDYLDVFPFDDGKRVGFLLSDSTGYGMSSAFMSLMLRLAVKLTKNDEQSPAAVLSKIFSELEITMKAKESLSIFYGVLDRKTLELRYCLAGDVNAIKIAKADRLVEKLDPSAPVLLKGESIEFKDETVDLQPEDRLLVFSDGFSEKFRNQGEIEELVLKTLSSGDAQEIVNEFVYRVKNDFESPDDMPNQDCSVLLIDVEPNVLRLTKTKSA